MITISPGHWGPKTGAHGLIDEGTENIKVAKEVTKKLRAAGITTNYIQDDVNKSQSKNINWLKAEHNKTSRNIDVSIHFNASGSQTDLAIGTEVLIYGDNNSFNAKLIVDGIAKSSNLKNRGVKIRKDLGILTTNKPCYLIEICFVNSKTDVALYEKHFDDICKSIANSLAKIVGKEIKEEVKTMNTVKEVVRELNINSQALNDTANAILSSRAQRELIVNAAIKQGMNVLWKAKLDNKTITHDEILALAAKTIVELNK